MRIVQNMVSYLSLSHRVEKAEKIGLLGVPSAYWVCADFAITMSGGVVVPFFPNGSRENLKYKISQTRMSKIFVLSNAEWIAELINDSLIQTIFSFTAYDHPKVVPVQQLYDFCEQETSELGIRLPYSISPDDLATIIYTSGSTGKPKGVCLTHRNFISQIECAAESFPLNRSHDRSLSCLPLAHSFERMIMYYYIYRKIPVYFNTDVLALAKDFLDVRPTVMTVVPRLLEKWMKKVEANIQDKGFLGKWFMDLKKKISRDDSFSLPESLKWLILKVLVFKKIRATMGGRMQFLISGGAALNPSLHKELLALGLPVYQGYGLTECSPVLTTNKPGQYKIGSVGKAFHQVSLRIGSDSEIQAKGPNVMQGYFDLPEESAAMFTEDHWLKTGDKGEIDEEGFLFVKGRLKELFKTSTGEYVNPAYLEGKLVSIPWVDLALIVGENKKFVSALIFPDFRFIEAWEVYRKSALSMDEFLESKMISDLTYARISRINEDLESWEKIIKWKLINRTVNIEGGELTPSFKLRRSAVLQKFASVIDSFYE